MTKFGNSHGLLLKTFFEIKEQRVTINALFIELDFKGSPFEVFKEETYYSTYIGKLHRQSLTYA